MSRRGNGLKGTEISRLCRLRNKSHGEDGQWAYKEITKLREQIAAQAAVIEKFKRAIGDWDRAETSSELQSAEAGLLKALAIPTDSTQILAEVRRAERERVAQFVDDNCTYGDTHILVKAIRAME